MSPGHSAKISKLRDDQSSLRSATSGEAAGASDLAGTGKVWRFPAPRAQEPSGAELEGRGDDAPSEAASPDAVQLATGKARILIIGEDEAMRQKLADYFGGHNLGAAGFPPSRDIAHAMSRFEPDLILLGELPEEGDRFHLLRDIRSRSDVPIVITTRGKRDAVDQIVALELGADDVLQQPFCERELLARIRAIMRRCDIARGAARRSPERGGFRFAGWKLNRRTRRLVAPGGDTVPITKGEYALLIAFLSAPLRPLSREQLLQATRIHEDVYDRSIDVQVLRLRRKLEINPAMPRFIRTERGVGYAFAIPVEAY
jgi:two-component system, OmpR family, response regulator